MATTDSRSRSVGTEERSDGVKPNSSDLEQITRERDEAVGLLREIVDGPGVECVPDADLQSRILDRLATIGN